MDIEEKAGKYVVSFEIPGVREDNILITAEDHSLNVIVMNKALTAEMRSGKMEIDFQSVLYDKTAVLENPDFSKMESCFFAGWLEVTIPKKLN